MRIKIGDVIKFNGFNFLVIELSKNCGTVDLMYFVSGCSSNISNVPIVLIKDCEVVTSLFCSDLKMEL